MLDVSPRDYTKIEDPNPAVWNESSAAASAMPNSLSKVADIDSAVRPPDGIAAATSSVTAFVSFLSDEQEKKQQRELRRHRDLRNNFVTAVQLLRSLRSAPNCKELLAAAIEKFSITVKPTDTIAVILQGLTNYADTETGKFDRGTLSRDRGIVIVLLGVPVDQIDLYIQSVGGVTGCYQAYLESQPAKKKRKRKDKIVTAKVGSVQSALKKHLHKTKDEVLLLAEQSGNRKLAPWSKKIPKLSAEARARFTEDLDQLIDKYSAIAGADAVAPDA